MQIKPHDRAVAKWATDKGFIFHYTRDDGCRDLHLTVQLGTLRASFHGGRLARLHAWCHGACVDQLMWELTQLFQFCGANHGFAAPGQLAMQSDTQLALETIRRE